MKHKQYGSAHIVLVGILVVLIIGALAYVFWNNSRTYESNTASNKNNTQDQSYVKLTDWQVRFPSNVKYDIRRNSATGNETAYFITLKELAKTCVTPDHAWLGIISRYENPNEQVTMGQYAGQTPNQLFWKAGMTIKGKLYVFRIMTPSCTRGQSANPQFEQAAEKLKSEMKQLESY